MEEVVIDVDEEHAGVVVQKMSERKAEMVELRPSGGNRQRLEIPRADARPDRLPVGVADRHARHGDHEPPVPCLPALQGRDRGAASRACCSPNDSGEAVAYAMFNLEDRGPMIIDAG
jgi:GTP-binding protein